MKRSPGFAKTGAVLGGKFLRTLSQVPILTLVIWGEEFGWRAYLLPKLMPLGARKAILLSGAVWGMFHWPMIFMGFGYGPDYWGAPIIGPLLFVMIILAPTAVYSWMTLRTGSVWPACIAHAVNNAFPALTIYFLRAEPNALLGPGVEGIFGCLGYMLLALPIFLSLRALAPAAMAISKNPAVFGKAAEQAEFGTSI